MRLQHAMYWTAQLMLVFGLNAFYILQVLPSDFSLINPFWIQLYLFILNKNKYHDRRNCNITYNQMKMLDS
jgi:hypothetical protein